MRLCALCRVDHVPRCQVPGVAGRSGPLARRAVRPAAFRPHARQGLWLSISGSLSLRVPDGRWRDALDPAVVALDVGVNRAWVTAQLGIHTTATKADLHDLVDRMWPEVKQLRRSAGVAELAESRSNGRSGRLDRPARAMYWRLRQFHGLTLGAIADEWETLTQSWSEVGSDGRIDRRRLEYPAWLEWRSRGHTAGIERFEEVGTIQRAIAKLRRLTG